MSVFLSFAKACKQKNVRVIAKIELNILKAPNTFDLIVKIAIILSCIHSVCNETSLSSE